MKDIWDLLNLLQSYYDWNSKSNSRECLSINCWLKSRYISRHMIDLYLIDSECSMQDNTYFSRILRTVYTSKTYFEVIDNWNQSLTRELSYSIFVLSIINKITKCILRTHLDSWETYRLSLACCRQLLKLRCNWIHTFFLRRMPTFDVIAGELQSVWKNESNNNTQHNIQTIPVNLAQNVAETAKGFWLFPQAFSARVLPKSQSCNRLQLTAKQWKPHCICIWYGEWSERVKWIQNNSELKCGESPPTGSHYEIP